MLFLVFGMICGIWLWKYWTYNIIYAALGVLLFSFILVMNTQMVRTLPRDLPPAPPHPVACVASSSVFPSLEPRASPWSSARHD